MESNQEVEEILHKKLVNSFGFIFEDELIQEIETIGVFKKVSEGAMLMDIGENLKHTPLLLSGAIKILREDEDGDELLLYFLESGDTCALTMTISIGKSKSEIRAIAERDTELILVPVEKVSEWILKYESWRSYVFESYNSRLKEMLEAIDSLAFMNMHDRTYKFLLDKVKINKSTEIENTHQEIAQELHSSRVVVSRILKQLENEGKIALHRNKIKILNY